MADTAAGRKDLAWGNQWAWLPAAKNLNELCLSLTRLVRRGGARGPWGSERKV